MKHFVRRAAVAAAFGVASTSVTVLAAAGAGDYEFQLVSKEIKAGAAKIAVQLVHKPDGKSVPDAAVIETRADMGPAGMEMMTVPVKVLGQAEAGIYQFEIKPSMAGSWALALTVKVPGEPEAVRGAVTIELEQ